MTGQGGSYVGRFAPSPTGPLHFGSLVAALASFLDARHAGGRWLLRIEDIDPPRDIKSAPAAIIRQLTACGLAFDGDVLYQSTRIDAYEAALAQLVEAGLVFPCTCSRASVGSVYQGTCRHRRFEDQHPPYAVRVRVDDAVIEFTDRVAGHMRVHLGRDVGDFIVKRRDGYFAYQLAVVVDDTWQGVTHVVRGNDLLDSTPRQIYLRQKLGCPAANWCHVPVIVDDRGGKLSKQNRARPVDVARPLTVLRQALRALGQPVPDGAGGVNGVIRRAIEAWDPEAIPRARHIRFSDLDQ